MTPALPTVNELTNSAASSIPRVAAVVVAEADLRLAPSQSGVTSCRAGRFLTKTMPVIAAAATTEPIPMNSPPRLLFRLIFLYSRGLLSAGYCDGSSSASALLNRSAAEFTISSSSLSKTSFHCCELIPITPLSDLWEPLKTDLKKQSVYYTHFHSNKGFRGDLMYL